LRNALPLFKYPGVAPYPSLSRFAAEADQSQTFKKARWRVLIKSLVAPALVLLFFGVAPHWYNSRVASSIIKEIEESAKVPGGEKARLIEMYRQVNFEKICRYPAPNEEKMRAALDRSGVCGRFEHLRWGWLASCGLAGVLLLALAAMLFFNGLAKRSPQALIRNYRRAWHIGLAAALIQVLLLIPLLTYGLFIFTVLLADRYYPQLLFVVVVGGILALIGSAKALVKKVPLEFQESMAREVSPEEAPELWQAVRQAAERLQTSPPDRVVIGMQLNFYVTELAVKHDTGVTSGKTLFLSHPLLRQLSEEEVVSVIGHELGHFIGEDTRLTREFYPMRMKIRGTMIALAQSGFVSWPSLYFLNFFTWCFGETEQTISRQRELLADEKAAAVTSAQTAGRALVKFQVVAEALNLGFADALRTADQNPFELPLRQVIAEKLVPKADFWLQLFEKRIPHPMDSHPALHVRLESLAQKISPSDAQTMATEESVPAYARWFSGKEALFADLTRQVEAVVGKLRSRTQVAEADYQTQAGRELLERHFPEKKWAAKGSSLTTMVTILGLVIAGCIVLAAAVKEPIVTLICAVVAIWFGVLAFVVWKRHRRAEFAVNAEGMAYSGWKRPVQFKEIHSLSGQKHYSTVTVTFRLKEKTDPIWKFSLLRYQQRSFQLSISSLKGKPEQIFETIARYCTRQIKE
jgi:Zn-dependent protease with chaperone function